MAVSPAYFDTSVLVKRYIPEGGSALARGLLNRYHVWSSAVAPVETISALCRRRFRGDVEERDAAAILDQLVTDRRGWELVALTSLVLSRAEVLIQGGTLTTLDAVHVATALTVESGTGRRVPFVTADARQRAAAERVNLEVVWVE